ncbi:MAG: aldehyde dehydrogenase family protein [Anaerolineales bacterium]|nr:aldehyde dehydrogenase family protein [Anaerolineales bacterium]MCB9126979.1 aldehyde dehydrogenase family protein [Ardenticatenales bacterium]
MSTLTLEFDNAHDSALQGATQRASYDPATGALLGHVPLVGRDGVDAALRSARAAQPTWAATPLKQRAALVDRVRALLVAEQSSIAELIALEQGKPVPEALAIELLSVMATLKWLGKEGARHLRPRRVDFQQPLFATKKGRYEFDPLGIVAIISPWNYPFSIPIGQVMAALMAGNAVVLKPSPYSPLTAQRIAELLRQAELPPGLFHVLHIEDDDAPHLTAHPEVNKVIFTGSVATGRKVMASAAAGPTPVVLELGGKDAAIVAADADLTRTVAGILWFAMANSGQTCAGIERVYVEETIYDRFVSEMKRQMLALRVDEGSRATSDVGPLSNEAQLATVEAQLADAVAQGARVEVGGHRLNRPGLFFAPTLLTEVREEMEVMQQETFGPLLPVAKVQSLDEAVKRANALPYGLSASVWTTNERLGWEIASQLRAGAVAINDHAFHWGEPTTPWGGVNQSGFGHTHGEAGLLEMVNVKLVSYDGRREALDAWWYPYDEQSRSFLQNSARFLYGRGLQRFWALISLAFNRRTWQRLNLVDFVRGLL